MSQELPPNKNTNEEIDLNFIFSYVEKIFNKIGALLLSLFSLLIIVGKKAFLFLLLLINLIKRNFIILALTGIISFGLFYYLNLIKPVDYASNMLLKQNFKTGKILYRNISAFNAFAIAKDSVALSRELGIPLDIAKNITAINITHNVNKNSLLKDYFDFQQSVDSTLSVSFEEFIIQENLEDFDVQSINVHSKTPNIYDGLSDAFLKSLLKNSYFETLKNNTRDTLISKKKLYTQLVEESDTLQSNYFSLLKNYYNLEDNRNSKATNSNINVNLDNKKDKIDTKEYDLFLNSKKLKIEINNIENKLKEKQEVFIIQKDFSTAYVVENVESLSPLNLALRAMLLVVLILLIKDLSLIKKLGEFGTKEKLFEKDAKQ